MEVHYADFSTQVAAVKVMLIVVRQHYSNTQIK